MHTPTNWRLLILAGWGGGGEQGEEEGCLRGDRRGQRRWHWPRNLRQEEEKEEEAWRRRSGEHGRNEGLLAMSFCKKNILK